MTQTRRIVTLPAGREQSEWLDVRPRQHGDRVPLRLRVEYQDQAGEMRYCEQTIHIAVARSEAVPREGQTVNVFVGGTSYHAEVHGSGAVAQGPGAAAAGAGGVAVGGDVQEAGGEKQEARGKRQEADDIASLRRQLEEALENLRLIEERKSQYVMAVDVPLQLVKEERRLRERIAELEDHVSEVAAEGAEGAVRSLESTRWNTATVRDLLSAAFSDEELVTFCFDYFPAVYEDLGGGMGKGQKVQRLLEHCLRRGQMEELFARVRTCNPSQYARFATQLGDDVE